jgi:hypothetical protein
MSRPNRPHRARYRFTGNTAKAFRGSPSFHVSSATASAFHRQRPKLDNEHDNENEHDSEERIPERPRTFGAGSTIGTVAPSASGQIDGGIFLGLKPGAELRCPFGFGAENQAYKRKIMLTIRIESSLFTRDKTDKAIRSSKGLASVSAFGLRPRVKTLD